MRVKSSLTVNSTFAENEFRRFHYRRRHIFPNMNIYFILLKSWTIIIRQPRSSRSQVIWLPSRIVIHSDEYQLQCFLNAMVRQLAWTPSDMDAKWLESERVRG